MKPKTNIAVDFSIIIPAYNEQNYIGPVLDKLFNAIAGIKNLTGEVIVVDNNCSDQTAILAKEKLNWEPKTTLEEGLKKTIDYFKKVL